ncbi:MAG: hypothetical protein OIN66_10880 [Candidatus Methanoperedens sp.]|nr:hypothetical protein [Candidatus Methanoperedens sp.]
MRVLIGENNEPQINADERRCILTTNYIKTTHRKGRKERKGVQQEPLRSGVDNRYSINNELVRTDTNSNYSEFVRVRISSLLMSILSFSLRPLRSLRLDVFSTPERAIRALHGVSAFICVHLRLISIKVAGGV